MGINKIQFQKGMSMAEFIENYGTEEKCHAVLVASRWPQGFVCPNCGETHHSTFGRKGLQYWLIRGELFWKSPHELLLTIIANCNNICI